MNNSDDDIGILYNIENFMVFYVIIFVNRTVLNVANFLNLTMSKFYFDIVKFIFISREFKSLVVYNK